MGIFTSFGGLGHTTNPISKVCLNCFLHEWAKGGSSLPARSAAPSHQIVIDDQMSQAGLTRYIYGSMPVSSQWEFLFHLAGSVILLTLSVKSK